MRLFDAILDANYRAIAGGNSAGAPCKRWKIPPRAAKLKMVYESL